MLQILQQQNLKIFPNIRRMININYDVFKGKFFITWLTTKLLNNFKQTFKVKILGFQFHFKIISTFQPGLRPSTSLKKL